MKHVLGIFLLLLAITSQAQQITVTGVVTDATEGYTLPGVSVVVKGTSFGTITTLDGTYSVKANKGDILLFSFVGMKSQELTITSSTINVSLESDVTDLDEVIVVGYGVQKKESVVGSIVQVTGEDLQQSGGVSTVGQALTGRLPGVTTVSSTGRPGDESPEIYIRGKSTWNGSGQPLILVDGIERSMNDIDMGDIESISVLKDASATAVFGVKGGNGVILITTKRGKKGKAQLSVSVSSTLKVPSKLPEKYDSYDGLMVANKAIEQGVSQKEEIWNDYTPMRILNKYRNPANNEESQIYPNVDWADYVQKDFAMDYRVNLSVRGGGDFAKYFGAISYQHVGDIFKGESLNNGRGYNADFSYNRFNYRSNIDFDITSTTRFSVNLSGYYGIQNGNGADSQVLYQSIYQLPPNIYYPIYDDGTYGRTAAYSWELQNPAVILAAKGSTQSHRVQVNSDFVLDQKLDFISKGLSFKGRLSYDNNFRGNGGVKEDNPTGSDNVIYKIYNEDGTYQIVTPSSGTNQFDFVLKPWYREGISIDDWSTSRKLFYQLSLNYNRTFNEKHTTSLLMLMNREDYATGNEFNHYREDWVGRLTYNYDSRYFIDLNGAYNGSEKFGDDYKFELFPSVALGWMISKESFMADYSSWLDKLKVRGSWGLVGDDNPGSRWSYVDQWGSGGAAFMDNDASWPGNKSSYTYYKETVIGNPDLKWETAEKINVGFEMSVFNNMLSLDVDLFKERRYDIIITSSDRKVSALFGANPPDANLGETEVKGLEVALGFRKKINDNWNVWSDIAYTFAKDKVISKEDSPFAEAYLQDKGYAIGQQRVKIRGDMMQSWDDVYGSTPQEFSQSYRRPGYYDEMDFNSDGIVNDDDKAPYAYSYRPQGTASLTMGAGFKDFTFMVQFYGVYNATKQYDDRTFVGGSTFFDFKSDYWTVDNSDGEEILPGKGVGGDTDSYRNWYDASFVRLKNIELAYTYKTEKGSQFRFFISGNDLAFWSELPDDRQNNTGSASYLRGDYPTFKRVNLGVNINF